MVGFFPGGLQVQPAPGDERLAVRLSGSDESKHVQYLPRQPLPDLATRAGRIENSIGYRDSGKGARILRGSASVFSSKAYPHPGCFPKCADVFEKTMLVLARCPQKVLKSAYLDDFSRVKCVGRGERREFAGASGTPLLFS